MSTQLGKTTGAFITGSVIWTNFIYVSSATIPGGNQIVRGGFRGDGNYAGGTASQTWRSVVFADNGSGRPGALLGYSPDATPITDSSSEADHTVDYSTPIEFASDTDIWIGVHGGGSGTPVIQVRGDLYSNDPTANYLIADTFSDGTPDPYPTSGGGSNSDTRAMWVEYDAIAGATNVNVTGVPTAATARFVGTFKTGISVGAARFAVAAAIPAPAVLATTGGRITLTLTPVDPTSL